MHMTKPLGDFRGTGPAVTHLDLGCELRGGQRQVLYLAMEQLQAGMQTRIASPRTAPILDAACKEGIPILALPCRWDFAPRNLFALSRALKPSALLHTHDARAASLGGLVALMRRDFFLVHTRRVSYALGQGWSRWKYALGDTVVCVSRDVEAVVRRAGISRTAVIPSAISLKRYSFRREGNIGRIGIIGALSPQKGHAQFFAALKLLHDVPEIWVVGTGHLEKSLRTLAAEHGIAQRIVWKGHVESPDVLPFLDILVVPSVHGEGSSGVIKEAWASGVPVVCSDLRANLELVVPGKNGLVFSNGDPADLAVQLHRLRSDPHLQNTLAKQGHVDAQQHDTSRMHADYEHIYKLVTSPVSDVVS